MTENIYQSWDTAIKSNGNNDKSVCTTWEEKKNGYYYLLDVYDKRVEYPDLKRDVISMAEKWRPIAILIEDKASGQSLIQDLRQQTIFSIIAINPVKDKICRFASVTPLIESGRVFLPRKSSWLQNYELQLVNFPKDIHDDMVDSTSQFLNWIRNRTHSPKMRII